ncbi:MAG: Tetratricopeptide repeat protein, partial [Acidobacteria bacterium]|nr:Tetratricopeptide repeat protein [Acidobacteriota bacterium]
MKMSLSRVVAGGAVVLVAALIVREAADRFRMVSGGAAPRSFSGRWTGMSYVPRAAAATSKGSSLFSFASAMGGGVRGSESHDEQTRAGVPAARGRRLEDVQRTLERCIQARPADARCWSNLAVVRLEAARLDDDPRGAIDAFGAADQAVRLSPALPEALFNRAAALEALHLSQFATRAWGQYLTIDGVSAWAGEARERLAAVPRSSQAQLWESEEARLQKAAASGNEATVREIVRAFPEQTRAMAEWDYLSAWAAAVRSGDAARAAERLVLARRIGAALREVNGERLLGDAVAAIDRASASELERLVDGHIVYGQAKKAYLNRQVVEAQPLFERAADAFRAGGSPMSTMAAGFTAACVCDRGEIARSRAMVEAQLAAAPAGYQALRGQLLWQRGTAAVRSGLVYEALNAYTDALAVFERLHESTNTNFMRSGLCTLEAETGRGNEAWTTRLRAFEDVSRGGDPQVLQTALGLAAYSEAVAGRWDTAASLYGLALESGLERGRPVPRAEAAIWFTLATHRLGWHDEARRSLEPARRWVGEIPDPAMRKATTSRLRMAEAVVVTADDPHRAVELLTANIDEVNAGGGDRLDLAETYLQ